MKTARAVLAASAVCVFAALTVLWSVTAFQLSGDAGGRASPIAGADGAAVGGQRAHRRFRATPNDMRCPGLESQSEKSRAVAALRSETVHVVIAFDPSPAYYPLVQACVMSMIRTSRNASRIALHMLAMADGLQAGRAYAASLRRDGALHSVDVATPPVPHPSQPYVAHGIESGFVNDLNIAHHLYVADTFPHVRFAVVIDTDTLVLEAIETLWEEAAAAMQSGQCETADGEPVMVAGVGHEYKSIGKYVNTLAAVNARYDADASTFGTGVMVLDLREWRRRDVTAQLWRYLDLDEEYNTEYVRVHALREVNGSYPIEAYRYHSGSARISGTRPLMNLFFYRSWYAVQAGWNVGDVCMRETPPPDARVLHFSGRHKPPSELCAPWALELWNSVFAPVSEHGTQQ